VDWLQLFLALISQKGPCDDVQHTTLPNNGCDLIIKRKYFPTLLFQTYKANRKLFSYLVPSLLASTSLLPAYIYFGRELFKKIASLKVQVLLMQAA